MPCRKEISKEWTQNKFLLNFNFCGLHNVCWHKPLVLIAGYLSCVINTVVAQSPSGTCCCCFVAVSDNVHHLTPQTQPSNVSLDNKRLFLEAVQTGLITCITSWKAKFLESVIWKIFLWRWWNSCFQNLILYLHFSFCNQVNVGFKCNLFAGDRSQGPERLRWGTAGSNAICSKVVRPRCVVPCSVDRATDRSSVSGILAAVLCTV